MILNEKLMISSLVLIVLKKNCYLNILSMDVDTYLDVVFCVQIPKEGAY